MLAVRIEQGHRHRHGAVLRHHLDELAGIEVPLHVVGGNLDQAEAGNAARDIGLRAVDGDATAHCDAACRALLAPFPLLDPSGGWRGVVDRPMRAEIIRRLRRAVAREISRARDVDQREVAEWPRDQTGITERADAHHAIGGVLDQIDGAIGDAEIDVDLRIAIEEGRQRRRDDQAADPPGHVDPEPARRFGGGME
ncbi:hypothetical protein chiPu_0029021, partial [Chiloscyllium punctatum]|nr:hypothetical protein [Chiloscyllium punctatum]